MTQVVEPTSRLLAQRVARSTHDGVCDPKSRRRGELPPGGSMTTDLWTQRQTSDRAKRSDAPRWPRQSAHLAARSTGPAVTGARIRAADEMLHHNAAAMPVTLDLIEPKPHRHAQFTAVNRNAHNCGSAGAGLTTSCKRTQHLRYGVARCHPDRDVFKERMHDYVELCRHIDELELPQTNEQIPRTWVRRAP